LEKISDKKKEVLKGEDEHLNMMITATLSKKKKN